MAISRSSQPVELIRPPGMIAGQAAWKKRIDNTFLIGFPLAGSVASIFWFRAHPIHWVEVITFAVGYFIVGMGTGVGFHRYFSHKSFETSPWVAYMLGAFGSMSFQSSLLTWTSDHRRHHSTHRQLRRRQPQPVCGRPLRPRELAPGPASRSHRMDVRRHCHRSQHLRPRSGALTQSFSVSMRAHITSGR